MTQLWLDIKDAFKLWMKEEYTESILNIYEKCKDRRCENIFFFKNDKQKCLCRCHIDFDNDRVEKGSFEKMVKEKLRNCSKYSTTIDDVVFDGFIGDYPEKDLWITTCCIHNDDRFVCVVGKDVNN